MYYIYTVYCCNAVTIRLPGRQTKEDWSRVGLQVPTDN